MPATQTATREIMDRVALRRESMWRHGNPLHGRRADSNEGPTRQRLAKARGTVQLPSKDRKVDRSYFREVPIFDDLFGSGKISDYCCHAGNKLAKHVTRASLGSKGVSSYGEYMPSGDPHLAYDEDRVHHVKMVASAKADMCSTAEGSNKWNALVSLINEDRTLEQIGRDWLGCRQKAQAYISGVALTRLALDKLATHWGMQQRQKVP